MDIDSLEEFIRMQKESLAREKHEFGLDLEHTPNPNTLSTEFSDLPKSDDHLVPSLLVETACNIPDNDSTSEQQQMHNKESEMIRNRPVLLQAHRQHQLVEHRRAVTAEKPQPVSESFYNYFPSLNTKKQQILEERRQEYFEYLKKQSPRPTHEEVRAQNVSDDHAEQRKMEKDRLAAQFQKSKQKSILNYQIVEARNRRAEEEVQRKKQEYYNELRKQIEDHKRRQQEQKQMEKFEDDIVNRKLELDELKGIAEVAPPRLPPRVPLQQPNPHRKTTNDNQVERESHRMDEQENHVSYNYFSNSAKDRQQLVQHNQKQNTSQHGPDHNPCCDNYKQILEKLEMLCRWRDDFVTKKIPTERRTGCLLCDSGNLRNCNFCDYHDSVLKGRDRFEESFTDSDQESLLQYNITERRELLTTSNRSQKMIAQSLSGMPTPQGVVVQRQRHEPVKEMPMTGPRNSSFINFDDIPLPTQRSPLEAPQQRKDVQSSPVVERIPDCRRRLNEMKKVEWKWDIPAVQKNSITKDKPEKVLTQLGAIRKQLQMEQLKQLNID